MILIALGSNVSFCSQTPKTILLNAIKTIEENATIIKLSQLYRSTAWPDPSDPPFVNAAAEIETALPPKALLAFLHKVEGQFGRIRDKRNAPRTLDLDLLAYDDEIITGDDAGGQGATQQGPSNQKQSNQKLSDQNPTISDLTGPDLIIPELMGPDLTGKALRLPHPEIAERDFVLAPLCDIAPDWRHPITGLTPVQMLKSLQRHDAQPISPD